MFMIWDSRQQDWQLFWLSFEHWVQGHPFGLIFSGPSKHNKLYLHTMMMSCNPLSTVFTPHLFLASHHDPTLITDDPSHLIYLQDHPLGLFFSGSSNHNELHLHTVMPCNPLSTVLTPPLLASPPWPRPDDPSHLIYPIVQGHPRGLIFSGPSKYSELHLHTVMPCNPLSTVLTPPLLASPLMTPAAAFTPVSVSQCSN